MLSDMDSIVEQLVNRIIDPDRLSGSPSTAASLSETVASVVVADEPTTNQMRALDQPDSKSLPAITSTPVTPTTVKLAPVKLAPVRLAPVTPPPVEPPPVEPPPVEPPVVVEPPPPVEPPVVAASVAAPSLLPLLQLAVPERRPADRPNRPVDFHALLGESGLAPAKKRKKRHPFRVLFKLVVVMAIIATGLFFAKRYVLDMRWTADLEPYSEAIADERQLAWTRAVTVQELPLVEYAPRLAATWLGVDAAELAALDPEWRAMGLSNGTLDLTAIGALATPSRPAFYDPTTKTVYEVAGVSGQLRELAVHRALTMALLDQQQQWSVRADATTPAARIGILALADGDATAVAEAIVGVRNNDAVTFAEQRADLTATTSELAQGASPYAAALVAGDAGVSALFDVLGRSPERDLMLATDVASDAAVVDVVRGLSSTPVDFGAAPEDTRGLVYWYHVMASRIPASQAWDAALAWNGDEVTVTTVAGRSCTSASIAAFDEASRQRFLDALVTWGQAAPAGSEVDVRPRGADRIELTSCDPGIGALPLVAGVVGAGPFGVAPFGDAPAEMLAIRELDIRDATAQTCVVNAVRAYDVVPVMLGGSVDEARAVLDSIDRACVATPAPA